MRSKFLLPFFVLLLAACSEPVVTADSQNEGRLGDRVEPVAVASTENAKGSGAPFVSLFDETTRKVRLFNLVTMAQEKVFDVIQPGERHYVQYHPDGNYVLDVSKKYLSVHARDGSTKHYPLFSFARPSSTIYQPQRGLLVYQNDNKTVFLLRLDANGGILENVPLGTDVGADGTIACGDANQAGELVLGFSSGKLGVVDVAATMAAKEWRYVLVPGVSLTDIKWIAPLRDRPREALVVSRDTLSLVNVDTGVTSSVSIKDKVVERYARQLDPHVILRSSKYQGSDTEVHWVDNGVLAVKKLPGRTATVLRSFLDVTGANRWVYAENNEPGGWTTWRELEDVRKSRRVLRYEWKQFLNSQDMTVVDDTQVEVTPNFVFTLFPYKAGYAEWRDLNTESVQAIRGFNVIDL